MSQVASSAEEDQKGVEKKTTIVLQVAEPDAAGKPQHVELKKLDGSDIQVYTVQAQEGDRKGEERKTITVTVVPGDEKAKHGEFQFHGTKNIRVLKTDVKPLTVQAHGIAVSADGDLSKQWPKIEEQLKAAGVDEKKITEIRAAMEKATKSVKAAGGDKHAIGIVVAKAEAVSAADRFMIGVACSPVGEALRAQLKLTPHAGLVVDSVFDDSPAKKAGIQPYDILLEAGNKKVQKPEDLAEAVQQAAKDKKPLSVTILRNGEKKVVEVAPAERPDYRLSINVAGDKQIVSRAIAVGPGVITLPGVQVQHYELKALTEKMDQLSKQVQELQEAVKKLQKDMR